MDVQSEEPLGHQAINYLDANEYDVSLPGPLLEALKKLGQEATNATFHDVSRQLRAELNNIKADFSGEIPDEQMENLAAIVYGPFLYGRKFFEAPGNESPTNITERKTKMLQNACAQDAIAHAVLWAPKPEVNETYAKHLHTMLTSAQVIADAKNPVLHIREWLNGTKGLIASMRALQNDGWTTYLPDYANNKQEVVEWDLTNYVDFVAARGDKVLFVDAKANSSEIHGLVRDRSITGDRNPYDWTGLPPSLQQYQSAYDTHKLKHVVITVPSRLDLLPDLVQHVPHKTAIAKYATSLCANEIQDRVNRLRWSTG